MPINNITGHEVVVGSRLTDLMACGNGWHITFATGDGRLAVVTNKTGPASLRMIECSNFQLLRGCEVRWVRLRPPSLFEIERDVYNDEHIICLDVAAHSPALDGDIVGMIALAVRGEISLSIEEVGYPCEEARTWGMTAKAFPITPMFKEQE